MKRRWIINSKRRLNRMEIGCHGALQLGERLGSGDGEREALMTRQMPYEPLPASVLFALVVWFMAS